MWSSDEGRTDLQSKLQSKLEAPDCPTVPRPETFCAHLKTTILQSPEDVLGFSAKKNQQPPVQAVNHPEKVVNQSRRRSSAPTLVTTGFLKPLKQSMARHQVASPSRITDGQGLLMDKAFILNHWAEHFQHSSAPITLSTTL